MGQGREPVESISAVTLLVSDMAGSCAFYEAIGFRVAYGGSDAAFTSLRAGRGFLNLQLDPERNDPTPLWGRVIFWVDDVDAAYDRVRAAGYGTETEPADASWGERYFHVRDPDGHELSFARPLGQ